MAIKFNYTNNFYQNDLSPILTFCGLYVDEKGYVRNNPEGRGEPYTVKSTNKKIIIVYNKESFLEYNSKKDELTLFDVINNDTHSLLLKNAIVSAIYYQYEDYFDSDNKTNEEADKEIADRIMIETIGEYEAGYDLFNILLENEITGIKDIFVSVMFPSSILLNIKRFMLYYETMLKFYPEYYNESYYEEIMKNDGENDNETVVYGRKFFTPFYELINRMESERKSNSKQLKTLRSDSDFKNERGEYESIDDSEFKDSLNIKDDSMSNVDDGTTGALEIDEDMSNIDI